MKIYAPVKNTNGIYASVHFVNGVGETNDPHLIEWFRSRGYQLSGNFSTVSELPAPSTLENEPNIESEEPVMMGYAERSMDFDAMSPLELRQWMMENGYGSQIRNTRNKEKLLEILRG